MESDSDFVYFKKPSGWKNHVYAYFYAGGDLRANNWQRAVYSIWPGMIPYESEVYYPNKDHDSYSKFALGIGNMTLMPGSTFKDANGSTIYRFRLPMGDRKNYSKIIFSDGMVGSGDGIQTGYYHGDGGGNESKMVELFAGYAYDKNGGKWQQADNVETTKTYVFRQKNNSNATTTSPDNADYLYIKNNDSDLWDDIHITFYNASGGAILQTGKGYVMKYAGTDNDGHQYFRIPIPSNAAKFAINNGNNKNDGKSSGIYPILQHGSANSATTTTGYQVYEIKSNTTLKLISPNEVVEQHTISNPSPTAQSEPVDYAVRTHIEDGNNVNDYVWIKNTGGWNENDFYNIKFKFYDAGGERITANDKEYKAFKRENDSDGKNWICKEIPVNAASFSISMGDNTECHYDIYPQATSGTTKEFTNGHMVYETQSNNTLSLVWPKNTDYSGGSSANDNFADSRGDYLYLVAEGDTWDNMRVVFKDKDGTAIENTSSQTEISAVRLGTLSLAEGTATSGETTTVSNAVGTWYKIAIPKDAASFELYDNTVSSSVKHSDKAYPIYPLRSSYSARKQDYTLGNMQYSIPSSGSENAYALNLIYPVFTEIDQPTNPYSSGDEPQQESFSQTADSINKENGAPLTRYTDVEPYATLPTATTPSFVGNTPSDTPVLYETSSDTITYQWNSSGGSDWTVPNRIYFEKPGTYYYNNQSLSCSWATCQINLRKPDPDNEGNYIYSDWKSVNYHDSNYSNTHLRTKQGSTAINKEVWYYEFNPADGWTEVQFKDSDSSHTWYQSNTTYYRDTTYFKKLITYGNTLGKGNYFKITTDHPIPGAGTDTDISLATPIIVEYYTDVPATVTTVTYQPEDRYGYISNPSATTDIGNFIKVVDKQGDTNLLTKPYISFYSDTAGNTVIGGSIDIKNAKLNGTEGQSGNGSAESPYLIRLPKNAKSVQLLDGTTERGGLITLNDDGGSTLTVARNGSNYTVTKTQTARNSTTVSDPEYKTDLDYIYFTASDNWISSADTGRIYAYYYGGVDGEYNAWPGVPAAGSYTDNSGTTVYYFRPPTLTSSSNSYPYPYVIFNNGSSDSRSITQKIEYSTGNIYTPNDTSVAYGTNSAKAVESVSKAADGYSKENYTKYSPDEKYIYIVNNGTQNVNNLNNADDRYLLDEMHVTFYSDENTVIADGTSEPGYYADKLEYGDYDGHDVYKISVPQNAKYFRISNGQGKGDDGSENHYRQSVIEQLSINGLYKFVDEGSTASQYWDGNNTSNLSSGNYYLTLINKRTDEEEEDDEPVITGSGEPVYIATVETDDDGLIKWITDLRTNEAGEIDTEYVANTKHDIKNTDVRTVKVVKWGKYFWREVTPPTGYNADKTDWDTFTVGAQEADKAVNVFTASDTHKHGKVQLTKTSEQALGNSDIGTPLENAEFRLYSKEDSTTAIYLLKKTGKSEYYVAEEKTGKSSIETDSEDTEHIYFKVIDETMLTVLEGYELDGDTAGQFKLYDTAITDENGKLIIDNLDWGEYYLEEVTAPDGYSEIDTTTGEANKVKFSVGRNTCDLTQELSCTDEIAPAKLMIKKMIDKYVPAWGIPTFIFKIKKISAEDSPTTYERLISLQLTETNTLTNATGWINIEPGKYEVTELPVSRYSIKFCTLGTNNTNEETYVTDMSNADKKAVFTVKENGEVTVTFENVVDYYDKFSHNDLQVNTFNGNKRIEIETVVKPVVDDDGKYLDKVEINKADLTGYFVSADGKKHDLVSADGKKHDLTAEQKESLVIKYVKQEKDDEKFGENFKDDTENKKIIIENPELFADGVYRMKATYGHISGTFDIILGGRSQKLKQFEKTLIFHADSDNLSYFMDGSIRTSQYEFTFSMVLKDGSTTEYEIHSIRHNGEEVTMADVLEIVNNKDKNDNNILRMIETHSGYTFSGWYQGNANVSRVLNEESIKEIVSSNNGEKTIVYTAKLTAP